MFPFWIVGHRGSPCEECENTLPSFERAITVDGANALELDICVTKDEELLVWHDADPAALEARLRQWKLEPQVKYCPRTFSRAVCEMTLAEARKCLGFEGVQGIHLPTLDEVIDWSRRRAELGLVFLDCKVTPQCLHLLPPFLRRLDRLVAAGVPRFQIVIETAFVEVIDGLKALGAKYAMALDVMPPPGLVLDWKRASAVRAAIKHGLAWATAQKPRPITLFPWRTHRRIVQKDLLHRARVQGICAFTINDEAEMRELVEMGVDAIQTDRPGILRQLVNRRLGVAA